MKTFKEWLIKENLDGYGQASIDGDDYSDYDDGEYWSNYKAQSDADDKYKTNATEYVHSLRKGTKTPVMYRGKNILLTKYADDSFMLGRRRMDIIDIVDMLNNGSLKINWAKLDDPSQRWGSNRPEPTRRGPTHDDT